MRPPRTGQEVNNNAPFELPEHGPPLQGCAGGEDNYRGQESREIFASQQNLTPHGCKQVEMEALIEHLSAEQVDKDTHAAKEDGQTQKIELEAGSKYELGLGQCIGVPAMGPDKFVIFELIGKVNLAIGVPVKDNTVFFSASVIISGILPVRFTELLDDLVGAESVFDVIERSLGYRMPGCLPGQALALMCAVD